MTEEYIDRNFTKIIAHESEIEARLIEGNCTAESLKNDNRRVIEEFGNAGEKVVLIDGFEKTLAELTESFGGKQA